VPLLKKIGLFDLMTYWIIQQVSFQAMVWEKQGVRPKLMAINLGDMAIKQAVRVNKIIAIINETGAKPEWLEFSIPESEIASNPDLVIPIIKQLVDAGLTVAIDDFAANSSLLPLLKTIPAQVIEIDTYFIRELAKNTDDAGITNYSIAMLHELGKTVIAKKVETEQQLESLKVSGCDMIQGHLLSRPLPPKEAKELLKTLPDFAWYFQQK
jgi:EAL domain-containing protein (putative c-di-GMP-specific phosphodiesterase class I)